MTLEAQAAEYRRLFPPKPIDFVNESHERGCALGRRFIDQLAAKHRADEHRQRRDVLLERAQAFVDAVRDRHRRESLT